MRAGTRVALYGLLLVALFAVSALLADLLVNEDTVVGMEDPGYPDARNIFASHTRHLLPLPVDEQGLRTGTQLLGCDYLFVTPGHQCPTTVTLSMERRASLLAMARQADSLIIEDDFESESRWGEGAIPALKSLDRDGRVIYVGSLAKSFAPGLRIGYIVAPRELAAELRALRRLMLRHPSAYIQRAFSLFISLGHHHSLLRRQSQAYQKRGAELAQALARHLPDFTAIPITGSSSCWLQGPPWLNAAALSEAALAEGRGRQGGAVGSGRAGEDAREAGLHPEGLPRDDRRVRVLREDGLRVVPKVDGGGLQGMAQARLRLGDLGLRRSVRLRRFRPSRRRVHRNRRTQDRPQDA